jgi:hypothetical protein
VNAKEDHGQTPFQRAAYNRHVGCGKAVVSTWIKCCDKSSMRKLSSKVDAETLKNRNSDTTDQGRC